MSTSPAPRLATPLLSGLVFFACFGAPRPLAAQASPASVTPAELPVPVPTAAPATPADPPWTYRLGEALFHPQIQVRTRAEERVHPYASPAPLDHESHFVTARFRLGLTMDYRAIRMVVQVQDARNFGVALPGTDPGTSFGIHQAYGEYRRDGSFVRIGRQEIAYGDERLVGPLDWASVARAFDAVRGRFERGMLTLDATAAMVSPAVTLNYAGPPPTTATTNGDFFAAGQLSLAPLDAFHIDVLQLYRRDGADTTSATRDRRIHATSLRLTGTPVRGFRYAAEGVFEWGEVSGERFRAYAAAADVFYATNTPNVATVSLGGALASGERAGRVGEFENFFPTNHKFYGFADLFGWRNLIEAHATVSQRLAHRPLTLFASVHGFFLEQTDARWTNAGGALVAAGAPGGSRYLGTELDVGGSYRLHELVGMTGGYSVFAPGSASTRLGHDALDHWFWLMLDFTTP